MIDYQQIYSKYKGAVLMDRVMSFELRKKARLILISTSAFFILIFLANTLGIFSLNSYLVNICRFFISVSFGIWLLLFLYECMYLSLRSKLLQEKMSYEVIYLYALTSKTTPLSAWFNSTWGYYISVRLGLDKEKVQKLQGNFTVSRKIFFDNEINSLSEFSLKLYDLYPDFRTLLLSHWIGKDDLKEISMWMEHHEVSNLQSRLIFSESRLMAIPSIGVNWAYGSIFSLDQYAREIFGGIFDRSIGVLFERAIGLLEQILLKRERANAIIIADSAVETSTYIRLVARSIRKGNITHSLQHARIFELDGLALVTTSENKIAFENTLGNVLKEASQAGNIILVIPMLPALIESAHTIGVNIVSILIPYLNHPDLRIVALSDRRGYHSTIEPHYDLLEFMEKVELDNMPEDLIREHTLDQVLKTEYRYNVFFLYQSIEIIADAVLKEAPNHPADVSGDLLDECAIFQREKAKLSNKYLLTIDREGATEFIKEKTGMKGATESKTESEVLFYLEDELKRRVVGQNFALITVSNALRRLKAGIASNKRPVASFLFVGPTGVGKTETAKALAAAYFGDESKILRLDMSEYGGSDGIEKLIGSFALGKNGFLSAMAKDSPHGVLLCDELEKANREVLNVFLQILDEGFFTDVRGDRINMRNFIIIATSNAGGPEIYKRVQNGEKLSEFKEIIIQSIIASGVFRPELLNRFDQVVMFEPLEKSALKEVAKIALEKYKEHLYKTKSIEIVIDDNLVVFVANHIENQGFGGRAINRVIQDYLESVIAKEILAGNARAGSRISFALNTDSKSLYSTYTPENEIKEVPQFIHSTISS